MPFTGTARGLLVGLGSVIGVIVLAGATVAWRSGDPSGPTLRPVVATADLAPEPLPPSTTSSTSTTSTSTSTTSTSTTSTSTTSTPTTVKRRPVTTTAPVAVTVPPVTAPRVTSPPAVAQPAANTPAERCATAHQWVVEHGLALPAGWGFRCPGQALVSGAERWGLACWNCQGDGTSWIAVDIARIGASEATLRYVIAHETCHANDYIALGITTEIGADLCAGLHGAPRP